MFIVFIVFLAFASGKLPKGVGSKLNFLRSRATLDNNDEYESKISEIASLPDSEFFTWMTNYIDNNIKVGVKIEGNSFLQEIIQTRLENAGFEVSRLKFSCDYHNQQTAKLVCWTATSLKRVYTNLPVNYRKVIWGKNIFKMKVIVETYNYYSESIKSGESYNSLCYFFNPHMQIGHENDERAYVSLYGILNSTSIDDKKYPMIAKYAEEIKSQIVEMGEHLYEAADTMSKKKDAEERIQKIKEFFEAHQIELEALGVRLKC